VDKSLVIVDVDRDGRRRYRFLETVRHYGRERLVQAGEADSVRARPSPSSSISLCAQSRS
jgi:predicted ATPase